MAIINGEIRCSCCKNFKPLNNFIPSVIKKGCGECRECKHKRKRIWEKKNPEKVAALDSRKRKKNREAINERQNKKNKENPEKAKCNNLKKYGLTKKLYDKIKENQGGKCSCCGGTNTTRDLYVDHCHISGKVRGLLCHKCNTGIGFLGDNEYGILKAIKYLKGK